MAAITRLVMFDMDGTLTESMALNATSYLRAIREMFGFSDVSADWSTYRHTTSAGILQEIVEVRAGRLPTDEESRRMQDVFNASLRSELESSGVCLVPGAAAILARLMDKPDAYAMAIASGNWSASARLILNSAGLPVDAIPSAFSDDEVSREGICRRAHQRAEEWRGHTIQQVIYIGDGVWDVQTSRTLGYGFVGIGRNAGAARLYAAGATEVLPDFQDVDAFLAAVEREAARLPPTSSRSAGTRASVR